MNRGRFIARYGGIYENSPWVAESVWDQGMRGEDPVSLVDPMRLVVDLAGRARQVTLLRAHPDLAGRLAMAGDVTEDSASEQASAGLNRCSKAEFSEFQSLNSTYKEAFGFPFVLAVRGHDRASILGIFRRRVQNDSGQEFREALSQVHKIARLRLEALEGDTE